MKPKTKEETSSTEVEELQEEGVVQTPPVEESGLEKEAETQTECLEELRQGGKEESDARRALSFLLAVADGEVAIPVAKVKSSEFPDLPPGVEPGPTDVLLVYDIGVHCHGREPYRLRGYVPLHGARSISVAHEFVSRFEQALLLVNQALRTYALNMVHEIKESLGALMDSGNK